MNRAVVVGKTLLVTVLAAAALVAHIPVALSAGMAAIMTANAEDARRQEDWTTHNWSIEEATRWNPHDYHARYRFGYNLIDRNQYHRAVEQYEACLEKSPGHLGALVGLSDLYTRMGAVDKAREVTARAVAVAPTSWRANLAAGVFESRVGAYDEAMRYLEKADRFSRAREATVYNQMGAASLLAGKPEAALEHTGRSLAMNRRDGEALLIRGKALAVLDRHEEAITAFELALLHIEDDPLHRSDAQLHLAGVLVEVGELLEASERIRDEVRESYDAPPVRSTADRILRRLSDRLAAAGLSADTAGEVKCNIGFAYAALGMFDEAARHFEAADATGAQLAVSCVWAHAETLLRLKRADDAVERYETAIAMGPGPSAMRIGYAEALALAGRTQDARLQYNLLLGAHELSDIEQARVEALADKLP